MREALLDMRAMSEEEQRAVAVSIVAISKTMIEVVEMTSPDRRELVSTVVVTALAQAFEEIYPGFSEEVRRRLTTLH